MGKGAFKLNLIGSFVWIWQKNAYLFSLKRQGQIPYITNGHYLDRKNMGRTIMNFSKRKLKIEKLPIPAYFSFSPTDDQFVREQEKIIALYKNKDFLKTTLTFLNLPTSNPGESITIHPSELR